MDKNNQKSITSSSAHAGDPARRRRHPELVCSLRSSTRVPLGTVPRDIAYGSGSINPTMWTLRQAQSDGAERLFELASRIFAKSENDKKDWIATGLQGYLNSLRTGQKSNPSSLRYSLGLQTKTVHQDAFYLALLAMTRKKSIIANLSPSVIANECEAISSNLALSS